MGEDKLQARDHVEDEDILSDDAPIPDEEIGPDEEPHMKGKVLNAVLCVLAFGILCAYLFLAGEANDLVYAVENIRWTWLALALVMVVLYWVLESACVQVFSNKIFPGFSFWKMNIVTVIGQYFNCVTPLSSGGQPFQAYYYHRFGMPYSKSAPMLLCRFISYQLVTTTYCAVVLVLRFTYFSTDYPALMALVIIGFIGGLGLMTGLLLLAFWKTGTIKAAKFFLKIGSKLHIVKDYEDMQKRAVALITSMYREARFLINQPKMLAKSAGITFIQLTEYFLISYVIYRGFGFNEADPLTIISCQAFVYMISSFVPTPGAMGAAEGSYALFFSSIYPSASFVALSTFIWRLLTFYFPIVVGMLATILVNHGKDVKNAHDRHVAEHAE